MSKNIVVLEGDQTGQELLEDALRVIDPGVTGFPVEFVRFDLSLENRRDTDNKIVYEAAESMRRHRLAIKAATTGSEGGRGQPQRHLTPGNRRRGHLARGPSHSRRATRGRHFRPD